MKMTTILPAYDAPPAWVGGARRDERRDDLRHCGAGRLPWYWTTPSTRPAHDTGRSVDDPREERPRTTRRQMESRVH